MANDYLYEVLIRGNAEGQITGAHEVRAVDAPHPITGVMQTHVGHATPLALDRVDDVLSAAFAGLANDMVALQADHAAKCADHDQLAADLATVIRERDHLAVEVQGAAERAAQHDAAMRDTAASLRQAMAEINDLRRQLSVVPPEPSAA